MFSLNECRYYAPCGLCTYYNRKCDDVCGKKKDTKTENSKIIDINKYRNDKGE